MQQQIALIEQAIRVAETKRDNGQRVLTQFARATRSALRASSRELAPPATEQLREIEEQLAQEKIELAGKEAALGALRERRAGAAGSASAARATPRRRRARRQSELEARAQALAALQAKIGQGKDNAGWLEARSLARAHRLWQGLDIEPGWEDALEAVLRERLNAVELDRLDAAAAWLAAGATPPGRLALYARE